jgi:hypothetical protein
MGFGNLAGFSGGANDMAAAAQGLLCSFYSPGKKDRR